MSRAEMWVMFFVARLSADPDWEVGAVTADHALSEFEKRWELDSNIQDRHIWWKERSQSTKERK